jgi:hypothetical protein
MLSLARRCRRIEDLGEVGSIEQFGSSARDRVCIKPLISAPGNDEVMGPNEKDDPIEARLREFAVDGSRGIAETTNPPTGGGVEVIVQSIISGVCHKRTREQSTRIDYIINTIHEVVAKFFF